METKDKIISQINRKVFTETSGGFILNSISCVITINERNNISSC